MDFKSGSLKFQIANLEQQFQYFSAFIRISALLAGRCNLDVKGSVFAIHKITIWV